MSLLHLFRANERNKAPLVVIDPRFTRTAAHANLFLRIRPGTDVPIIWGMLWHIFQNGWEDKEYIRQRVYGMDKVREEVAKWTPEEVERVTGVRPELVKQAVAAQPLPLPEADNLVATEANGTPQSSSAPVVIPVAASADPPVVSEAEPSAFMRLRTSR